MAEQLLIPQRRQGCLMVDTGEATAYVLVPDVAQHRRASFAIVAPIGVDVRNVGDPHPLKKQEIFPNGTIKVPEGAALYFTRRKQAEEIEIGGVRFAIRHIGELGVGIELTQGEDAILAVTTEEDVYGLVEYSAQALRRVAVR